MKPLPVNVVENSTDTSPKRDWYAIVIMFLCLSLLPTFLITEIIWIAFAWFGSLFWLFRNRPQIKDALRSIFGDRVRQGTAILVIICIASSFTIVHEAMYAGNLQWGVEIGDQFSYTIITPENYGIGDQNLDLNNSIVVFEITSLPIIPLYCERTLFLNLIVNQIKANVTFDNGSILDSSGESDLITLFSNSLLPIGDWWFIDSLYYEHARGGLGAPVQDPWFSRFEGSVFHFGKAQITCTGSMGWDADISVEDGVPIAIRDFPYGWEPIITLTRIV